MKYSFEVKKEIYEKHCEGYGSYYLSKEYGLNGADIRYLCRLVDKHGLNAIRQSNVKSLMQINTHKKVD